MRVLIVGGCGYVGSGLAGFLSKRGHDVHSVDLLVRGNPGHINNVVKSFRQLVPAELEPFDATILLAGVASVSEAILEPFIAVRDNTLGFVEMLERMPSHQLFIYASSGSVYDGYGDSLPQEDSPLKEPQNIYDLSKMLADNWAQVRSQRVTGLRFGTVAGPSPNIRLELIVNRMVLTALQEGKVFVANPTKSRAILALPDLCITVERLMLMNGEPPRLLNVASLNATIGEIGFRVASHLNADLVERGDSPTYDFTMDTARMRMVTDHRPMELEAIVDDLVRSYRGG